MYGGGIRADIMPGLSVADTLTHCIANLWLTWVLIKIFMNFSITCKSLILLCYKAAEISTDNTGNCARFQIQSVFALPI